MDNGIPAVLFLLGCGRVLLFLILYFTVDWDYLEAVLERRMQADMQRIERELAQRRLRREQGRASDCEAQIAE